MKGRIILWSIFFVFSYLNAQVKHQYFDGADTTFAYSINVELDTNKSNIWKIGRPHKTIFNRAATVPNVIVTDTLNYYPTNNKSHFRVKILNNFDGYTYGMYALQWLQKLDLDTNRDGGIVEYSFDNGDSWHNAFNDPAIYTFYGFDDRNKDTLNTGEYAFSGIDTTWKNVWLCFNFYGLTKAPDTLNFRFTLKSDSINNNREGWMIDNMMAQHTYFVHPVKNIGKRNYLIVYPNPSNRIVNIEMERSLNIENIDQMELINAHGKTVEKWNNIPSKFGFDAVKYGDGNYFLKVRIGKRTETTQIVVGIH